MRMNGTKGLLRKIAHIPDRLYKTLTINDTLDRDAVDLSIVAIIKNEGQYIEEWVRYHIVAGVQKFYLYNNDSSDNTEEVLKKYIDAGHVDLIPFPGVAMQLLAYNDAIYRFKHKTRYMAIIDADEFLYSCNKRMSVRDEVADIFSSFPQAGGIAVNWRMFGSRGLLKKPIRGGVLDNFLYRAKEDGKGNNCIKTIVNPRRVYKYEHVHFPTYLMGFYSVDENGNKVNGWSNEITEINKIRINHYFTKSKEEWIVRRSMGKADYKDRSQIRTLQEFEEHDNNDIYDNGMLFYVDKMKELNI